MILDRYMCILFIINLYSIFYLFIAMLLFLYNILYFGHKLQNKQCHFTLLVWKLYFRYSIVVNWKDYRNPICYFIISLIEQWTVLSMFRF